MFELNTKMLLCSPVFITFAHVVVVPLLRFHIEFAPLFKWQISGRSFSLAIGACIFVACTRIYTCGCTEIALFSYLRLKRIPIRSKLGNRNKFALMSQRVNWFACFFIMFLEEDRKKIHTKHTLHVHTYTFAHSMRWLFSILFCRKQL